MLMAALTTIPGTQALGASAARDALRADAARTLSVNDQAHLRVVRENGSTFTEEGHATGTLPGTVQSTLTLGVSTVRSGFTIHLRNGSISGYGAAKLNAGHGEYSSFGGTLTVNHGSGNYAHASGTGRLYGTINRNNDNATVQVIGQLHL